MRRAGTALVVAVGLLAGACNGPREPIDVGVREVASDIVLGSQATPRPAGPVASPIPPTPVALNIPTPVRLPAPPRFAPAPGPTTPRPVRGSCPAADPLQVPRHPADEGAGTAPVAESFEVRNDGTFTVSGPNANEGRFEESSVRHVHDVVVDDAGDVTYDVSTTLAGTGTVTSYLLRNSRSFDDGLGVGDQAGLDQQRGLYLTQVLSKMPDDRLSSFRPATPLRLLRFPAFAGDTFESAGTDPVTGTTMRWTVTVEGHVRVDLCGELVDAIRVHLSNGRVDGPEANVEFAATYDIATQYGGLILRDQVTASGREGLDTVTRTNTAVLTSVPTHRSEVDG